LNSIVNYFKEAVHELRLVKWPTQQHAVKVSIITVIFVVFSMLFLGTTDFILSEINSMIHGNRITELQQQQAKTKATPIEIKSEDIKINASDAKGNPVTISTDQIKINKTANENETAAETNSTKATNQ